jgi:hypothetical protein
MPKLGKQHALILVQIEAMAIQEANQGEVLDIHAESDAGWETNEENTGL